MTRISGLFVLFGCSFSSFNSCPSCMSIVATDNRKQFQCLNIVSKINVRTDLSFFFIKKKTENSMTILKCWRGFRSTKSNSVSLGITFLSSWLVSDDWCSRPQEPNNQLSPLTTTFLDDYLSFVHKSFKNLNKDSILNSTQQWFSHRHCKRSTLTPSGCTVVSQISKAFVSCQEF